MKTNFLIIVLALLLPGLTAGAEQSSGSGGKVPRGDANFIKEAWQANKMEVELGKVAQEKAAGKQVKEFGRRMEQDHGKALKELEQIAAKKNVELPKELEGRHKREVERLSKLSGEKFDREYIQAMVKDHKEDIEKFQRESEKGDDPDAKKYAAKHLPTLKQHLELAQTTGQQVGALRDR